MSDTIYSKLSVERKQLQKQGLIPEWMTTSGWQLFKEKYLYGTDEAVFGQYKRIAKAAAKHVKEQYPEAEEEFFKLLWKGWLSPSTPILANMGTYRGLPVACSGSVIEDSIDSFYSTRHETAILTKYGFGTSAYLGDIRPRGSRISVGGTASGVVPVFKGFVQDMRDVAQGTARRGAWAGYLPIEHDDFDELCDFLAAEPDDVNIGWVISDKVIKLLSDNEPETLRRFQKALKTKMVTGKGYFWKVDAANAHSPAMYKDKGFEVKASNLCVEINLMSDSDHTFTCVLSSMNYAKYDEWKDTEAIVYATLFLDCVASEFIEKASGINGLEKAVRATEKGRALGLGMCGLHTYFQLKGIPYESLDASFLNSKLTKELHDKSYAASHVLSKILGEPEWCKGYGLRNTHRTAVAPTKSTALIMGGVSEGINPDPAMAFTQTTAGGAVERINPILYELMKKKGVYTKKYLQEVIDAFGSVQLVDWLDEEEKKVFKTAFEINQEVVVRYAAARQKYLDQGQSINLFFAADEDPAWISHIHKQAFENPNILGLYYITTLAGVHGSRECESCQ